jgi:hypothetical protein
LSGALRRITQALRKTGLHINHDRKGHSGTKIITIEARAEGRQKTSSAPSAPSAEDAEPNESNGLGETIADDPTDSADDQTDDADDRQMMTNCGIVSANELKNNRETDADDADDDLPPPSGTGGIAASGYAVSHSPQDRQPGPSARVWIKEIVPVPLGPPGDDLNDFV